MCTTSISRSGAEEPGNEAIDSPDGFSSGRVWGQWSGDGMVGTVGLGTVGSGTLGLGRSDLGTVGSWDGGVGDGGVRCVYNFNIVFRSGGAWERGYTEGWTIRYGS